MKAIRTALSPVLLCCGSAGLVGQTPAPGPDVPGSQISVALVTMGPGSNIWDRFGHNAIWIRDPDSRINQLYNYGIYDFNAENFVLRFIQGRMLYRMGSGDPDVTFRYFSERANRSVWVQELNLTPAQRIELRDFLLWNDRPENQEYRYDYYYDNCSTRVRDALDRVLGGVIQRQTEETPAGTTLRFHTRRLTTNNVWYYTGLMIALGPMVDKPITVREEMFLPMSLRDHLRGISVTGPDGNPEPLIASERTVYESTRPPSDEAPPSWTLAYLAAGIVLAGLLFWLAGAGVASKRSRVAFASVSTAWMLVVGVLGAVLFGLVVATDHASAYWNENLFLFNPLSLALALTVPLAALGVRWANRPVMLLAVAVAGLSALGFIAQILPGLDQINGELYALVLLPNVAVAVGVFRLNGSREQGAGNSDS